MSLSLLEKLKKNSSIKESSILNKSKIFAEKESITTDIYSINIAFSGDLNGGFSSGSTMWAGPSKHFKTGFSLLMARAYQDKYPDGVILFYDSEFGSPQSYFDSFGVDTSKVFHTPITDIEELKFDIMNQLKDINRGDKVMIIIDSIGNLASKKEVEDALEQKSVADMTRAKQIKSLFRMITPHMNLKDIPLIIINHTYKEQTMYPKDIVGGGTGSYYSSDNIFILGRQQEKDGNEITGYNFIIRVEKSRTIKENSKIPLYISFKDGISKFSGLIDLALESGHIIKPQNGWYSRVNKITGEIEEKKFRLNQTNTEEFWSDVINQPSFNEFINNKYILAAGEMTDETDMGEIENA